MRILLMGGLSVRPANNLQAQRKCPHYSDSVKTIVIPAQAGIQNWTNEPDARLSRA
jgi:hypothetical protein